jgi:hypothetical protein
MHHIEYLIVSAADPERTFAGALGELRRLGYHECPDPPPRHVGSICAWPLREGPGTRVILPRGFDRGDEIARILAQALVVPALRLFAEAGLVWGYDAFAPGGQQAISFRSDRSRRGDEGAELALWAGQGVKLARSIAPILNPTTGAEGPAAVEALALALGAPYPSLAEHEHPTLRTLLLREESP